MKEIKKLNYNNEDFHTIRYQVFILTYNGTLALLIQSKNFLNWRRRFKEIYNFLHILQFK